MFQNKLIYQEPIKRIMGKVELETIRKRMEGKTLKQVERNYLSRSIRPKLIAAQILCQEHVLEGISRKQKIDTSLIEYNLSIYGYELISVHFKKSRKMPLEELIAEILVKCPSARFIEAIPILLVKNKIDSFKLLELAVKHGIKNKIGYLLETAFISRNIPSLKGLLDYLKATQEKEISFLAEGDEEFLRKTSPKRVKNWNLLGRFFDDDFKKLAKVYL